MKYISLAAIILLLLAGLAGANHVTEVSMAQNDTGASWEAGAA